MLERECQEEREKCNKGDHSYKTRTVCSWSQQASGSTVLHSGHHQKR